MEAEEAEVLPVGPRPETVLISDIAEINFRQFEIKKQKKISLQFHMVFDDIFSA